jgi:prepilin-type N-terminal cleavage/methylation domain-containing protein
MLNNKLIHMNKNIRTNKGFTLLEILLVIAVIGILAAIVLVSINPNRQIAQVRNAQRRSDINTIYKALEQYLIDTGNYPNSVNSNFKEICNTGTEQVGGATDCSGKADLRSLVPTYLAAIPTASNGGIYRVGINLANNRISLAANSELGQSIVINEIIAAGGDLVYTVNVEGTKYLVHEFKTIGTSLFNLMKGIEVEFLVVGGGGGGGSACNGGAGGGGGAGGLLTNSANLSTGNYSITVGAGGSSDVSGQNSVFASNTAIGGGTQSTIGGSGGGGYHTVLGAAGTAGQGNRGGQGSAGVNNTSKPKSGGGGGGYSTAGQDRFGETGTGGAGGAGLKSSITGVLVGYAGGGAGGAYGTGGIATDGGGNGGGTGVNGSNGLANTGGGGGGAGASTGSCGIGNSTRLGGSGGSGIVIVRYLLP